MSTINAKDADYNVSKQFKLIVTVLKQAFFMPQPSPAAPRGHKPEPSNSDAPGNVPTIEVGSIIGSGREAVILHKGERYRLRVTANGKLILTK